MSAGTPPLFSVLVTALLVGACLPPVPGAACRTDADCMAQNRCEQQVCVARGEGSSGSSSSSSSSSSSGGGAHVLCQTNPNGYCDAPSFCCAPLGAEDGQCMTNAGSCFNSRYFCDDKADCPGTTICCFDGLTAQCAEPAACTDDELCSNDDNRCSSGACTPVLNRGLCR
ncbi:MAG: hypothetical protein AB2A00_37020 [Myxococcota bacterium]